jgi:hypothetical protein
MAEISDGLEALRSIMSLREVASLIGRTARWVAPETFKMLPLWFPEYGRRGLFFKGNWSAPQMNTNRVTGHSIHKSEGNVHANKALSCCHDVKAMLRLCARNLYGWPCEHAEFLLTNAGLDKWADWDSYPPSWPTTAHGKVPLGVVALSATIRASAQKHLACIRRDLEHAGGYYPREEVRAALAYWKVEF